MESVVAALILALISSGESMMLIRDFGDLLDFDIFSVGFWRDITRCTGAVHSMLVWVRELKVRGLAYRS